MTPWSIDWQGRKRQPCPACARGPKDTTCGLMVGDRGLVAHCFRCGHVEREHDNRDGPARAANRPAWALNPGPRHLTLSEHGRALWAACQPLAGTGLEYLKARGCRIPPTDSDLRWHPNLMHPPTGMIGPALVARVTDAGTGQAITLHRTWVRKDGTKAPYLPARMLLGGHRKQGGVIRLWPDGHIGARLGIAEGIETALSLARLQGVPAWAAIDAGNLSAFAVISQVEALFVAVDHDEAGIKASRECRERWQRAGKTVRLVMPKTPGQDINDEARAQGGY